MTTASRPRRAARARKQAKDVPGSPGAVSASIRAPRLFYEGPVSLADEGLIAERLAVVQLVIGGRVVRSWGPEAWPSVGADVRIKIYRLDLTDDELLKMKRA